MVLVCSPKPRITLVIRRNGPNLQVPHSFSACALPSLACGKARTCAQNVRGSATACRSAEKWRPSQYEPFRVKDRQVSVSKTRAVSSELGREETNLGLRQTSTESGLSTHSATACMACISANSITTIDMSRAKSTRNPPDLCAVDRRAQTISAYHSKINLAKASRKNHFGHILRHARLLSARRLPQ